MEERIKVYNDTKFDIGLRDQRGIEFNIKPGQFAIFSRMDIEYFVAIARSLFDEPHYLRIDDADQNLSCGLTTEEPNKLDKTNIKKNLQASVSKVNKYVESITDPYVLDTVCDVAIEMDLSNSKMNKLRERCPSKFGE